MATASRCGIYGGPPQCGTFPHIVYTSKCERLSLSKPPATERNVLDWKHGTRLSLCDKILVLMAVNNICLQCDMNIVTFLSIFFPEMFQYKNTYSTLCVFVIFPLYFSFWITAGLCIFYCLRIVSFKHHLFVQLKMNISEVVPRFLMAAAVGSFGVSVLSIWHIELASSNENANLSTGMFKNNVTILLSPSYKVLTLVLGCCLPFVLAFLSIVLTLYSLLQHVRSMKKSMAGFSIPRLDAHVRAAQIMIHLTVLYAAFYISEIARSRGPTKKTSQYLYGKMLLLLITALLLQDSECQGDLTAQIHMVGTTGSISINTNTWILRTNLTGTCGSVSISIHEFPVVYGASQDPCGEEFIGRPRYSVTMNGVGQMVVESKIRYDGRSLTLQTCGRRTCVNLQDGSHRTWQAKFHSFIIGQAYFVQSLNMMTGVLDVAILEGSPASNASLLFSSSCLIHNGLVFGSIELGSNQKFVKSRLELSNVTMMSFLLVKYNERWVCAEVKTINPKVAVSAFSMLGMNGTFTFRQDSCFHPTEITINLWRLRGQAGHYGIHSLPILPRQESRQNVCTIANTGQLWNPLDVSSQSASARGGHSSWPLGDLSGRHSTLQGQDKFMAVLVDWNLPMFGNNSIVGRSVVISKTSGEAWACSTIVPQEQVTRAIAVFHKGVIGRIMFQQARNDPYTQSCTNAGGHFNPYNVPVSGNYSNECKSLRPLWCEAGDYASKHEPISFLIPGPARYVFTDASTSLNGTNSIIGRSLVVHGANGVSTRMACANILLQRSREGRSSVWFGSGNAHGELKASQASELDPTLVHFTFYGLRGFAGGFHIHLLPVSGTFDDPCSNALIRGHFNPFSIEMSMSPGAGNGTDDEYEVGDISGRRRSLHNQDNVTNQYTDMNFPLSGTHSILGRSLVIHYANGSRMQCTSFLRDLPSDGQWVRATAEFSGAVSGRISLSQIVFPDGGLADTTILVDLQSSSSTSGKTSSLEWLIQTVEHGGEPYNPYEVPSQTINWCTSLSPQLCRVGDLMGKHGPVTPGDKVLVTDPNLPLAGDFTVIGRSVTLTSDTLKLSSLILPDVPITSLYFQRMTSFNRSAFREALSLILNIDPWRVTLLPDSPDNVTMCQRVAFFIIGSNDTGTLASIHAQETLGPPCLSPSGSLESSAGRDLKTMAASLIIVSLLLLL
ncbi:uncharacterized protein LOC142656723 [Rhinoderma darwinii]|uniref:uncharacterized protein LOC142656723 n=1 Tax=Rhinoderma darwinii TaxID=43563 RepID=UPI003F673503